MKYVFLIIPFFCVGCNCQKKIQRFNERTLKMERKLIDKGCAVMTRDSIPEPLNLPDTIKLPIYVEGETIHDTFRIECENNKPVVYGKSNFKLQGNKLTTEVKCPDIDSVITIYNEDKVKEEERANKCCQGWEQCEAKRLEAANVEVCGFWCDVKKYGIGFLFGIFVSIGGYFILKLKSLL